MHAPARRAVLLVLVVAGLLLGTVDPVPAAEADGILIDAETTYTLDPAGRSVAVEVSARLTNTVADRRIGNAIRQSYIHTLFLPVIGEVADLSATGPGGQLSASVEPGEGGTDLLVIRLSPRLLHGSPQDITVRYELPAAPPRSDDITRVNEAYGAWFVTTPGDPGDAALTIELPEGFELSLAGTTARLRRDTTDGRLTLHAEGTSDPDELQFPVSVVRTAALTSQAVDLGDAVLTVRAWPGDSEWQDFTVDLVERGMPVLRELVGADLKDPSLEVLETSGGTHVGYAGFFTADGRIEVSDQLDGETLLHELTHAWINGGLFTERWLTEGVTQEVTHRAATRLDIEVEEVPEPDPTAEVTVPLNAWGDRSLLVEEELLLEEWGYAHSHAVANLLLGDLTDDELAHVLGNAIEGHVAYQGDPQPERVVVGDDWRYVLDLVQQLGGVEDAPEIYLDHVLTAGETHQLDDRAEARESYAALVERSGTWTPPLPVRTAMAKWDFEDVPALIDAADQLRGAADAIDARLVALGGDLPDEVETAYEGAPSLDTVTALLDQFGDLAARLTDLTARQERLTPVERLGLLGSDDGLADAAVTAATRGDVEAAGALTDAEAARLHGAERVGWTRLGAAGAGLGLLLGAVLLARRRRGADTAEGPSSVDSAEGPSSVDPAEGPSSAADESEPSA